MSTFRIAALAALTLALSACGSGKSGSALDLSHCSLQADRTSGVLADGVDAVAVTATVRDSAGNPLPGVAVTFAGPGVSIDTPAPTDAAGVTTAHVTSTVAQTATLTASVAQGPFPSSVQIQFTPPGPTQLAFVSQPTDTRINATLPAVQVRVLDAAGNPLPDASVPVTIGLGTNPSAADLYGTVTVTTSHGVASFTDLRLDQLGSGYTLAAVSSGVQSATSSPFAIVAGTAQPNDITGVVGQRIALVDGGQQQVWTDLTQQPVAALVPQPDGSYARYTGVAVDAGTFDVPGVPDGGYVLQVGSAYYGPSQSRSWELIERGWGRADATAMDAGASLTANVSGLDPWQPTDSLVGWSPTVTWYESYDGSTFDAGVQSKTVTLPTYVSGNSLVEASRGDYGYFLQMRASSATVTLVDGGTDGVAVLGLDRASKFTTLEMTQGGSTSLDVPMVAVQRNHIMSAQIDFPAFAQALPKGDPSYGEYASFILASGLDPTNSHDSVDVSFNDPTSALATNTVTTSYGVLPEDLTQSVIVLCASYEGRSGTLNGVSYVLVSAVRQQGDLSALNSTLKPSLGVVWNIAVNDKYALAGPLTGVGLTPSFEWSSPTLGTPTFYRIYVAERAPTPRVVATLNTTQNSFTLPPGVLTAGATYALKVYAYLRSGASLERPYSAGSETFTLRESQLFTP